MKINPYGRAGTLLGTAMASLISTRHSADERLAIAMRELIEIYSAEYQVPDEEVQGLLTRITDLFQAHSEMAVDEWIPQLTADAKEELATNIFAAYNAVTDARDAFQSSDQ